MNREDFIKFIEYIGFRQVWEDDKNYFSLATDIFGKVNVNYTAYCNQLTIHIYDDSICRVSISEINNGMPMISDRNVFNFNLKSFDNDQQQIFLGFISRSFKIVPHCVIEMIRDIKIENVILNKKL